MNWIERIGCGDGSGNLSFNKCVTAVAMAVFTFAVVTRRDPAWPLLSFGVVVIGAGFGLKGFLGAVKQDTIQAQLNHDIALNTNVHVDAAEVVRALKHRDPTLGVDPA